MLSKQNLSMDKILIATGNKHKREKLLWIVSGLFEKIEFPENLEIKIEVEEDGKTFEENAVKKAVEFSKHYDGYTISTDGGILIPVLGNLWNGLRTKRFAGEKATDFERIEKLLELMKDKNGEERKMVWNEAIAIAKDGKLLFSKQVEGIEGVLQTEFDKSKYREGIWVCSVWFFPQFNKNFFDLSTEEVSKAEVSWKKLRKATHKFLPIK